MVKRIILILLLTFSPALGDVVQYVDPDAGGANNGSSWTDAYTALATWEAQNRNMVNETQKMIVYCRSLNGTDDTAAVNISGWTTSVDYDISIVGADFSATGVWDDQAYTLSLANAACITLSTGAEFTSIRKIQFLSSEDDTAGSAVGIFTNLTAESQLTNIDSCIFKGVCTGTGSAMAVYTQQSTSIVSVINCIIYGFISGSDAQFYGINFAAGTTSSVVYNCTIFGNYIGIRENTGGPPTCKNCVIVNNTDDIAGTWTLDYLVTDDDHSGNCANYWANPTAGAENYTLDFTTPGSDFRLLSTAANLINDALADVFPEDDDIIDVGRPQGAGWDIGAYEYVPPGEPGGVNKCYYRRNMQ